MNRFSTFLLLLVAVALAVFIGTTHRWRFSTERILQPGAPLFQFEPDQISSIGIKNGDQSFRIERFGEDWRLTKGMEDFAAPEAVNALMQTALQTPVLDRIESEEIRDDKNLSAFGVLKSSLQIDFKGDNPSSLLIGKTSPDGTRNYVAFQNSKTVYLIPNDIVRLITLPIENFRDRRLLPIQPEQIERMEFRKANTALNLQRDADGWKILQPLQAKADDAAVEALVSKIQSLRLENFHSKDKSETSTETQLASITSVHFFPTDGGPAYSIELTAPSPAGSVSAHLKPRNISGTLSANASDLLTPDIEPLRDSALLRINLDMVDVIRTETNGSRQDITRTREGWSTDSPNVRNLSKTLAQTKVTARLPATPSELSKCGLGAPIKRITFLAVQSENTPESPAGKYTVSAIAIGKPMDDGRLPVLVEGTPEIRLVPADLLEKLP
jgi:hypothetical protein